MTHDDPPDGALHTPDRRQWWDGEQWRPAPRRAGQPAQPQVVSEPHWGLGRRVSAAFQVNMLETRRRAAFRMLISFIATFLLLRLLTYGIRYQFLPLHNIESGGLHIHHFVWGIFILLGVGFLALTIGGAQWHPRLAIPFGIGAALVIDEFALWLNLQDVYWAKEGRISIDLALVVAAALALYWVANCFWRQVVGETRALLGLVLRREGRELRRQSREISLAEFRPHGTLAAGASEEAGEPGITG